MKRAVFLILSTLLGACQGAVNKPLLPTPSGFAVAMTSTDWTISGSAWLTGNASTCTIRTAGSSTYRMFLSGPSDILSSGISETGSDQTLNIGSFTGTGVGTSRCRSGTAETIHNPTVLKLGGGQGIMIYEVSEHGSISATHPTRFYLATGSYPYTTFTNVDGSGPDDEVLTADATTWLDEDGLMSVPDLIQGTSGQIWLYFVTRHGGQDRIDRASSADNGQTWTRDGGVTISGLPANAQLADPDILQIGSNYSLFFTMNDASADPTTCPAGCARTHKSVWRATGTDGMTFTLDSSAAIEAAPLTTPPAEDLTDPEVVVMPGGGYRMFFGKHQGTTDLYSATISAL